MPARGGSGNPEPARHPAGPVRRPPLAVKVEAMSRWPAVLVVGAALGFAGGCGGDDVGTRDVESRILHALRSQGLDVDVVECTPDPGHDHEWGCDVVIGETGNNPLGREYHAVARDGKVTIRRER